jgi:hypothetical protein
LTTDVHEIQWKDLFKHLIFQAFQRLASLFRQIPRDSLDSDVFKAKSIQLTSGGAQMGGMGGAISSLFPESTKAILDSHGFWIYKCDQCNFETKYSGNIKEHFKTEKHLRNTKGN